MKFQVICSTADGNQTKDFSNWESAHQYANEWMDGFTHWNHRHFNNVESSEYVNLWKTRNGEVVKIQEIKSDIDCPNCADQASIAAPGQTVLCKTHSDEKHYAEMNEFFDSQLSNLKFSVHMPFCSACGNDEAYYIGYIQGEIVTTHYSFCSDCRSKVVLKQNAARAAQERIGA